MLLIYCVWNIFSLSSSLFLGYYSASVFGISNILGLVICTFPSLGTSAEWRELFSWERIDSVCVFVRDQTMANYSLTLSTSRMCWQLILTLLFWFFQNGDFFPDLPFIWSQSWWLRAWSVNLISCAKLIPRWQRHPYPWKSFMAILKFAMKNKKYPSIFLDISIYTIYISYICVIVPYPFC